MSAGHLTDFSVSVAVRTEVENEVAVVRKRPQAQVYQFGELKDGFDVRVCLTERRLRLVIHVERVESTTNTSKKIMHESIHPP